MMKIIRVIILTTALFLCGLNALLSQSPAQPDCSFLKDCTLMLKQNGEESIVVIKDDKHMELLDAGNSWVKSDLEWISDCEYAATVNSFKWPEFIFEVGEVLYARVVKIEGDSVFMKFRVQDMELEGMYLRVD